MRYVALLRGINVTGNTMIKMAELKKSFESLGLKNVTSYVNSGNLAFDSRKVSEKGIVKRLEDVIEKDFGKRVQVMVREQNQIPEIISGNPYDGEFESPQEMHVLFLKDEIPKERIAELREVAPKAERFTIKGREIYCHLPMGVADSLMGRGLVEKKLRIPITARNWRTVQKLAEL
jgi:uncharacterized protein (DUF1697 family)